MNTKQKILETALGLFNQEGTNHISTNHIAAALGISSGNLYYHYRSKEDIIRALFNQFDRSAEAGYTLENETPSLQDLEQLIQANFTLQWHYRFLFRDLIDLLRRDPELETMYRQHRQRGFEGNRELIRLFSDKKIITPVKDDFDLDVLTRLIWLVSDFWLASLELGGEPVTPQTFQLGVALLRRITQ
jgi:AcrR family transcriptional regulator